MKDLLLRHLNTEIGVNLIKPTFVEPVRLVTVHDDYFTVEHEHDGNKYHIPFLNIVKVIENPEGVTVGGFFKQRKTYPFVIKIGHLVDFIPL